MVLLAALNIQIMQGQVLKESINKERQGSNKIDKAVKA